MVRRVCITSKVKNLRFGAEARASLKGAKQFVVHDPKPGDLPMSRLKWR